MYIGDGNHYKDGLSILSTVLKVCNKKFSVSYSVTSYFFSLFQPVHNERDVLFKYLFQQT